MKQEKAKIYGVKFNGKTGKRICDAEGFVAEVGVDDQIVRNDFDNVLPWAGMRRCNTVIRDGERVPTFFEGEAGFDNVNLDVFVYVPLFFYNRVRECDGEVVLVSDQQADIVMDPPRKFVRKDGTFRPFVFLPAYTAGIKNGRLASCSGLDPFITSLNGWMDLTEPMIDICIESTMDDEIKNVLLDVEFATRDPQSIMAGAVNSSRIWPSGECDAVKASSGSPHDNTSGKYPCKYRGIENPWGNQYRWRWDVLVKDGDPYILEDRSAYRKGKVTEDYKKLTYRIAGSDGWADKFGYDPRFPQVQIPTEVTSSYEKSEYGVYFWQWPDGICALLVGGVSNGRDAGARYCSVSCGPGSSSWSIGAALSPA